MLDTDNPTSTEQQAYDERTIFECFAEYASLPVETATIESRPSPEPDILCQMTDGDWVAFELGELCDQRFKHAHGKMMQFRRLLHDSVDELPPTARAKFLERFTDARIDVRFDPDVNAQHYRNAILALYSWLIDHEPKENEVLSDELPRSISDVIGAVTITRPRPRMIEPSFGIRVAPPPLNLLQRKVSARYVSKHPIELLLHSHLPLPDAWIAAYGHTVREVIDGSNFRRVWIFSPSERAMTGALKMDYRRPR